MWKDLSSCIRVLILTDFFTKETREVNFSASYLHQTVAGVRKKKKGLKMLVFTIIMNIRPSLLCVVVREQLKREGPDIYTYIVLSVHVSVCFLNSSMKML